MAENTVNLESDLSSESEAGQTEHWDSLKPASLVALPQTKYGFSTSQTAATSMRDLYQLMKSNATDAEAEAAFTVWQVDACSLDFHDHELLR